MQPNFSSTVSDYARYRRPFPPALFERLRAVGIGSQNQRMLDLGAGTGLLGSAFQVTGCKVWAVDSSLALLAASPNAELTRVVAKAEAIPFPRDFFDTVIAGQCWHWFDRHQAPLEIFRVLKPGGFVAAVYQMYAPLIGSVAEATEKLILRYQPRWRHANSAGINGQVLRDLQSNGFVDIESFSFDVNHRFSHEEWRGFIRTTSAVGASLTPDRLKSFDLDHAALLNPWPESLEIPHRIFAAIARKPGSRL